MKNISVILFLLISISANATIIIIPTENYVFRDGRWYFENRTERTSKEVVGAHIRTFRVLDCDNPLISVECHYARDRNHIYYKGERMKNVDIRSFQVILPHSPYSKDKNNVFFEGKILENADPATFRLVTYVGKHRPTSARCLPPYAKDKNFVFRDGVIIPRDVSTFRIISSTHFWGHYRWYTADKFGIYFDGRLLEGSLADDFQFLGWPDYLYLISNNNVYYGATKLKGVDAKSENFRVDWPYLIGNSRVFHRGTEIKTADAESFEVLNVSHNITCCETIARDKNHVYMYRQILTGLDAESFEIIDRNFLIVRDKNGTYRIEQNRDWIFVAVPIEVE